jgi:metallo-beta-lactamase class B
MFAKKRSLATLTLPALAALPLLLASCAAAREPQAAALPQGAVTPQQWAAACAEDAGWDDPGPPFRIHGNTWYVGTCGIAAILITGDEGHVLIDSGTEKGAEVVVANIQRLGFKLDDVNLLLISHEHHDHAGGTALLQRLTGAELALSAEAATVIASGRPDPADPQFGLNPEMTPASLGTVLPDDGRVMLGKLALQAIPTPGHTLGATSWQWQSCAPAATAGAQADCRSIVYADSLSAYSNASYRYGDHPELVQAFRDGLDRVEAVQCSMLLTPHPSASAMHPRAARGLPADPAGCAAYARAKRTALDERLAEEAAR